MEVPSFYLFLLPCNTCPPVHDLLLESDYVLFLSIVDCAQFVLSLTLAVYAVCLDYITWSCEEL